MTEKRMIFIFQIAIALMAVAIVAYGMHEVFATITAKLALVKV